MQAVMDIHKVLKNSRLLKLAPEETLARVVNIIEPLRVEAGKLIIQQGDVGSTMYLIASGQVKIHNDDIVLTYLDCGELFGEMAALSEDVRSASVSCEQDCLLYRIERDDFYALMAIDTFIAQAMIKLMCHREKTVVKSIIESSLKVKTLERELEIGRDIQAGFLPQQLPQAPGWDIAAYFQAAQEVAGDFYDIFEIPSLNRLGFVIGDVCGKGVGSALYMTLFRSLLRAASVSDDFMGWGSSSAELDLSRNKKAGDAHQRAIQNLLNSVTLTNNYIAHTHGRSSMFASLFFGLLDPIDGTLLYINAGHEPLLVFNDKGVCAQLESNAPVVGIFPNIDYIVQSVVLNTDDTLLAYTDGITEAMNGQRERFTDMRLKFVLEEKGCSCQKVLDNIVEKVTWFAGGEKQVDDITMFAVKRLSHKNADENTSQHELSAKNLLK